MEFKTILMELSNEVVEKIQKAGTVEVKADDNTGKFDVVASTETPDRAGESVMVKGWDLGNYKKSPIILFGHDYRDIKNVIGKATSITKTNIDGKPVLRAKGIFSGTEQGQIARQLYDEGILKTVSVGFRVLERLESDRSIITKAELLEISFVPVPCNPEALSIEKGLIQKGFDLGLLTKEVEDVEETEDEELLDVEETEDEEGVEPQAEEIVDEVEDEDDSVEKRLEKIENSLNNLSDNISEIKSVIMEKKDLQENAQTSEQVQTMEKIATVVNTALKKFKK